MLIRSCRIIGALLPCAATLGLAMGCSSSSRAPTRSSESRRDIQVVPARYESRDHNNRDAYQRDRIVKTAETRSSVGTVSLTSGTADRVTRTSDESMDDGVIGAAEQHGRVTMVASNAPPMTLMEFPSHQPRDGEFWVPGIWRGESGQYIWQPGHMEQDRPGQLYMAAYWIPSPRGWEYAPEYWR